MAYKVLDKLNPASLVSPISYSDCYNTIYFSHSGLVSVLRTFSFSPCPRLWDIFFSLTIQLFLLLFANYRQYWILISYCYFCCSLALSYPTICDPMHCCMPGFPVLRYLPKFAQIHVHWVSDAIQPSHPLSPLSPPALNVTSTKNLN